MSARASASRANGRKVERRRAVRYACALEGFYRPLGAGGAWLWWLAVVHNVSVKGIGLTVTRQVEPGTLVSLDMQNGSQTFRRTPLVRVVYSHPRAEENRWDVGGVFIDPLTEDDLQALL